ncbi:MAG: ABC transporter substrate-binding protein [Syntrophobacteraceae bacterium]
MRYCRGFTGLLFVAIMGLVLAGPAVYGIAEAKEVAIGFSGPLSGVGAEYGQDCANGLDMAVNDINAAGGITVGGEKYTLKLVKLDDRIDPTEAVNNCRRLQDQDKTPAIFNPVFNTIAAMAKINEEKDHEFLVMGYTSTPKMIQLGNKLLAGIPPPFTVYLRLFADQAMKWGFRKAAMVVTLGAYGDEWRHSFKEYWESKGGQITEDKPANYYTETDFSAQLTAAIASKPDVMLIGGPSAPTALVIEQARNLGYKGGFILVDQAKADYIANILKGTELMNGTIGVGVVAQLPYAAMVPFDKKYTELYKRMQTWEVSLNYTAMHALARAMVAAGTVSDPVAIRAALPKAFPLLGDKFPVEFFGITPAGRMELAASVMYIKDGKYSPAQLWYWWFKTEEEFNLFKKEHPAPGNVTMNFLKFEHEE